MLLLALFFTWTPLFSNQSGDGLKLPEVVVVGEDRARLEGFRDFGLLPALAPGIKLEPVADRLNLSPGRDDASPRWETASGPAPGCAYRNPVTASLARGLGGAEAYYSSGRQKYLEQLFDEARGYFLTGLDKYPDSPLVPDFHYWLGEIAIRREDNAAARRHFQLAARPGSRFFHYSCYSLAWLDYREKKFAEGAKWFAKAALGSEARLTSASLFWEGEALLRCDRQAEGEAVLKRLVATFPQAAEYRAGLYRLATLAFNRRDYRAALELLEKMPRPAGDADMLQRQADLARGWCLYFLASYPEARSLFARLQSPGAGVDDVVPLAFLGQVLALLRENDLDGARQLFAARPPELKSSPVAAAALRELIAASLKAGRLKLTLALGDELVTGFPPVLLKVEDFRFLARLRVDRKEYQKALQTLALGLRLFSRDPKARVRLQLERAQVLCAAGRVDEALPLLTELFAERELISGAADRDLLYLLYTRALNHQKRYAQTLKVLSLLPPGSSVSGQADLLYERGWAALKSHLYGPAVEDFSGFLNLAAGQGKSSSIMENAELNRAEALFNLHRDEEAQAVLENFVHRHPESPFLSRARNYLGLIALRHGEFEKASRIFKTILDEDRKLDDKLKPEVIFNLGESLFSREKFRQAIAVYERLTREYPGSEICGRSLIRMGESYFNLGEYLKAQLVYLKAKQAFPGGAIDEKASYGMLLLAYNQDKHQYLEIEVKRFIRRFPESSYTVPLLMLLVDLYQRQGRENDLLALLRDLENGDYARVLKLEAYYRHFQVDLKAGRNAAAVADCQRLLKLFPGSKYECDCRLFLARQDFAAGKPEAALARLGNLSGICPDMALRRKATLLKARIYQSVGDFDKARKNYTAVVDENSSDRFAYQAFSGLGRLFAERREFDEALFFYKKAAANPDTRAAARATLDRAEVLEKAGKRRAALQACLRLSYLFPKEKELIVEALLRAVRLARAGKDTQTAARVLEKLKSLPLSGTQRKELQKLLSKR